MNNPKILIPLTDEPHVLRFSYPTLQAAWDACDRLDWLQWLVTREPWAAYDAATRKAQSVYDAATRKAQSVYDEAVREPRAVYNAATREPWAVYAEALREADAVYDEAVREPRAVYDAAEREADACRTCDELRSKFACPEVPEKNTRNP